MSINLTQPDILVYGNATDPVAVVEVKNIQRLSQAQAVALRRTLLENKIGPGIGSYLIIVSQEAGYLWEPMLANADGELQPNAIFNMREVLAEYLGNPEFDLHLRGSELELVIMQWLSDLSRGRGRLPSNDPSLSRLAAKIRGARIELGARL